MGTRWTPSPIQYNTQAVLIPAHTTGSDVFIVDYILIVDHVAVALVASGNSWAFSSRAAWVGDMDGAGNVLGVGGLQVREWLAA